MNTNNTQSNYDSAIDVSSKLIVSQNMRLIYKLYAPIHHFLTDLGSITVLSYHPAYIIRNHLSRALYKAVFSDDRLIAVKTADDFLVVVPLNDQAAASIIFEHAYSPEQVKTLLKLMSICSIFIDVGANLGYFSLLCAHNFTSASVTAVEPNGRLCGLIRASSFMNGFKNINVINVAVGQEIGLGKLHINPRLSSNAVVQYSKDEDQYSDINVVKLDDIVQRNARESQVLIKVDVEGMEIDVLKGGVRALRDGAIFMSEVCRHSLDKLETILREFDYKLLSFNGEELMVSELGRKQQTDVILAPTNKVNFLCRLLRKS